MGWALSHRKDPAGPRGAPKRQKNDFKNDPRNEPKMNPKSSQHDPQIIQTENCQNVTKKSLMKGQVAGKKTDKF